MAEEKVLALDADGTKAATGRRAAEERRAAADRWSFMPVLTIVAYGSKRYYTSWYERRRGMNANP
jgi:hypothetical protein